VNVLDTNRAVRRVRIDADRFAEELARQFKDIGAPAAARSSLDHVAVLARDFAHDISKGAADLHVDQRVDGLGTRVDEIGQRIKGAVNTTGIRAAIARLERDLPDTNKDRYARAYARGRAQARSKYLVVGIVAGVGMGIVVAALLDPKRGKARRDRIAGSVKGTARTATDKARDDATERGLLTTDATQAIAVAAEASAGAVVSPETMETPVVAGV